MERLRPRRADGCLAAGAILKYHPVIRPIALLKAVAIEEHPDRDAVSATGSSRSVLRRYRRSFAGPPGAKRRIAARTIPPKPAATSNEFRDTATLERSGMNRGL